MTNLDKIISKVNNSKVYIQTHNFPDPDAIASAYGLSVLLRIRGIDAQIIYKGSIDKTVTAKMVRRLGIKVVECKSADVLKNDDEIIIVDAQKGNANIVNMNGKEIICIDHHPIYLDDIYQFSDIRPEIGACASIIASYYTENNIEIPKDVATALLYGIKVDTADMKRGVSDLDMEMFCKLHALADNDTLYDLDNSTMEMSDLKAYSIAISSIDIYESVCFADAGKNCPDALIANIADFLITLNGIELAVIYSVKEDGIKISIRSNSFYRAGHIINIALHGIGSGGGHDNMAGGYVNFNGKSRDEIDLNQLIIELKERFLKTVDISVE